MRSLLLFLPTFVVFPIACQADPGPSELAAVDVDDASVATSLPIVNLGYVDHQAIFFNATGDFYNFSNIRYGEAPIGNLRFSASVLPQGRSQAISSGSHGVVCPQASGGWDAEAPQFLTYILNANTVDPRITEDCLFLDVIVPHAIYDAKDKLADNRGGGAPVLVYVHGGGYVVGSKSDTPLSGNPAGIIEASQVSGSAGVIFVTINYRLGAFGFLSGPSVQSNGNANAGLYDQRLALQWVQKYIYLFGGDPTKVTVIGESAGAGAIMHQITAFGGANGPPPFSQAILQSPAWQIVTNASQEQAIAQDFFSILNVTTLEEARRLPSSVLIAANVHQVNASEYGATTFGPVIDGVFAPALPGQLLLHGSFYKGLKLMVGHVADEALIFTPPLNTSAGLAEFLESVFPFMSSNVLNYITTVLYPPVFDGSYGYTDYLSQLNFVFTESLFSCNTNYLARAFLNQTYNYLFSVPPGIHAEDVAYTFYNGPTSLVSNQTLAVALQEYITSFATNGVPSGPSLPKFPQYGKGATILDLNMTSITKMTDPTANPRCYWWQQALYA